MALQEVMGSRQESAGHLQSEGTMLYVGLQGTAGATWVTDKPAVDGSLFFTPYGGSVESGNHGRRCFKFESDPETLPGVIFVTCHFRAFLAMA